MDKLNVNSTLAALCNRPVSRDRRDELIYEGAVLTLEYAGRARNSALVRANRAAEDFGTVFESESGYNRKASEWSDDVLYFCAKRSNDIAGKPTDRADRRTFTGAALATDPVFMQLLSGVVGEILNTVTPALVSDLVGEMCSVVTTPRGKTYEAEITSNAVIRWYDANHTSLRAVPQDQLYNRSITLNPRPVATRFSINYYHMTAGNGSLVRTIAAVSAGYAAKLMEKFTSAFTSAAADTRYVPSSLKATGYSDSNWASLCNNVAKANRVRRDQLVAYGSYLSLRKVLPDNATLAPAVMTMMGDEYFRNGYLSSHDGVMLYELQPTSTPGTINSTLTDVFPTDTIVIAARAGLRYAPMIMCFEEDCDAQLMLTPGDSVLADGRIEGLSMTSYEIAPAFASRIGVMSSIV